MVLHRTVLLAGVLGTAALLPGMDTDATSWSGRVGSRDEVRRENLLVAAATQTATGLSRVRWLSGCWELRSPRRVTLEMWMPPDGDLMLGASRTTVGGVAREYEQLRLSTDGDVIVYTASPSGQQETAFRSTVVSDSSLVFENLAHDFPQRILYRRQGADSLIARIEGPGPNGTRGIDFPMRRVACTGP